MLNASEARRTVNYFSFVSPNHRPALAKATRKDLRELDSALADERRRAVAETVLALAAELVAESDADTETEPLSPDEHATLARLGLVEAEPLSNAAFVASAPVREGLALRARMVAQAETLAQAARRMGVSDSRLRQRLAEGTLVAIPRAHGRGWLIPAFQLTPTGELPYLGQILSARRRNVAAEALGVFFEAQNEELGGRSPRDWLMAGGDPAPIKRLMAAL